MTSGNIITGALRLVGGLKHGQAENIDERAAAVEVLNAFMDSLNADRTNIFTVRQSVYTLTAGQQTYTIGTGGAFNGDRPQEIEKANLILPGGTLRRPLELLNDAQWASIRLLGVQSTIPQYLYNDGNFPLSTLYLWPIPSVGQQLELYTWQLLTQFADEDAVIELPPGYAEMLRYNLAVRLAAEYDRPLRAEVAELARESLATVQRANLPAPVLSCDAGVLNRRRSSGFNWLTGELV